MKNYLSKTLVVFFIGVLSLNAQEKKDVHLKIVKNINGTITEIDTIIEGNNLKDGHFYCSHSSKDSLDKNGFIFITKDGSMKVVNCKDGFTIIDSDSMDISNEIRILGDSLKYTITSGGEWDDKDGHVKVVAIKKDGDNSVSGDKNVFIFTDGDCNTVHKGDGSKSVISKVNVIKGEDSKNYIEFVVDIKSEDAKTKIAEIESALKEQGENVKIEKSETEDGKIRIKAEFTNNTKSDKNEESESNISEIIITKGNVNTKTMEVIFKDDGENSDVEIIELEDALKSNAENVRITRYQTEDGMLVIKAEFCTGELCNEEKEQLKSLGIQDKKELDVKNLKIFPNPSEGIFKLEMELEGKKGVELKVFNQSGALVYSEKVKKTEGSLIKEIDISREETGTYFLQIIQGDKSVTRKLIKN